MFRRFVAALLVISLTACSIVPRRHTLAPVSNEWAGSPAASGSTGAGTADEPMTDTAGSPNADKPQSGPAGPARVIAAVLLIALFVVALVAGAQSLSRDIARSCCHAR